MRRSWTNDGVVMAALSVAAFMLGIAAGRYLFPHTEFIVVQPASQVLNIGGANDRIP